MGVYNNYLKVIASNIVAIRYMLFDTIISDFSQQATNLEYTVVIYCYAYYYSVYVSFCIELSVYAVFCSTFRYIIGHVRPLYHMSTPVVIYYSLIYYVGVVCISY